MTARQARFPGSSEHARAARRWAAEQIGHPYADLLTAELWNAVVATGTESVLVTVTARGGITRITAYGSRAVPLDALTDISGQILSTLTARHGIAPAATGFRLVAV